MRGTSKKLPLAFRLAISGLGVLFVVVGCRGGPAGWRMPPSGGELPEVSLDALQGKIISNASKFRSLVAECNVVMRSDLLPSEQQIVMSGSIQLVKPKKVHLLLKYEGRLAIELVGDGTNYNVRTPIFANSLPYGGKYGDPVRPLSNRIHFLPEDLADALDLNDLFVGKLQVLRGYPEGFDLLEGGFDSRPVAQPPVWHIDSVAGTDEPRPAVKVLNSVAIDRRTEQIIRLDKFRWNGSLRTRIWYSNARPVRTATGAIVEVPSELMIWYPRPLQHTMIRLRLERIRLDVSVPEERFTLGE